MLFSNCSCGSIRRMHENYDRPVSRDDLLFTVEMALRKAEAFWPKKYVPGDHDRLKPAARAVVEHLELCGMRCFAKPPRPPHGTPDPWGASRKRGADGRVARPEVKGDPSA